MTMFDEIIEEYEKYYGYSLTHDDPIKLIGDLETDILIIHDKYDKATPFEHSEIASKNNNTRPAAEISCIGTTGTPSEPAGLPAGNFIPSQVWHSAP